MNNPVARRSKPHKNVSKILSIEALIASRAGGAKTS